MISVWPLCEGIASQNPAAQYVAENDGEVCPAAWSLVKKHLLHPWIGWKKI